MDAIELAVKSSPTVFERLANVGYCSWRILLLLASNPPLDRVKFWASVGHRLTHSISCYPLIFVVLFCYWMWSVEFLILLRWQRMPLILFGFVSIFVWCLLPSNFRGYFLAAAFKTLPCIIILYNNNNNNKVTRIIIRIIVRVMAVAKCLEYVIRSLGETWLFRPRNKYAIKSDNNSNNNNVKKA